LFVGDVVSGSSVLFKCPNTQQSTVNSQAEGRRKKEEGRGHSTVNSQQSTVNFELGFKSELRYQTNPHTGEFDLYAFLDPIFT
jgi:hypothetical protein